MATVATRVGRFSILQLEMPGQASISAGVLLEDPAQDRLYLRFRRDWDVIAPDEAVILSELEFDLGAKAMEVGAELLLRQLQDTLSNTLTISAPREVMVEDFNRAVIRLYSELVSSTVRPFVTHLPRYSLAVAAGKFLGNQEVVAEGWEEAPADLRLTESMFVARIAGRSMEPRIPDGSLNLFRLQPAGSRQGKILLIERFGVLDETARYTIKRYTSRKIATGEDQWEHTGITLEPLNPEFEPWDLEPDSFAEVAEWLRVIE